jgi:hypothetical protein
MPLATGAGGKPLEAAMPVCVSFVYGATPIDQPFFVATRAFRVTKILYRVLVTAASATAVVTKCATTVAAASGTALHSGTIALDNTADANATLTLSATAADLSLAAGDALALDVSGTTTNAKGVVTVELIPLA